MLAKRCLGVLTDTVGYGPKMLARVLRFRRLQTFAGRPTPGGGGSGALLADIALDAGYADQAHMTAEVTQLAGIPPVRFLAEQAPTTA